MKIELDLEKHEAILLLKSLKRLQASTENPQTFQSISEIIAEIESDAMMNEEIYKILRAHLRNFKHPNARISMNSHLRLGLRLRPLFLNRANGLKAVCNRVLHRILITYKPSSSSKGVPLKGVHKCQTVQDVINLIKVTYEAAV